MTTTTAVSCPTCGRRPARTYRHRMDHSKVSLLEKIGHINVAGVAWVKVQRDGNLIKEDERAWTIQCDDVHALRLSWFGLLETRKPRSGEYRITEKGVSFLAGHSNIPAWIECKRGRVLSQSNEWLGINSVNDVILDKNYWDLYARGLAA